MDLWWRISRIRKHTLLQFLIYGYLPKVLFWNGLSPRRDFEITWPSTLILSLRKWEAEHEVICSRSSAGWWWGLLLSQSVLFPPNPVFSHYNSRKAEASPQRKKAPVPPGFPSWDLSPEIAVGVSQWGWCWLDNTGALSCVRWRLGNWLSYKENESQK